MAAFIVQLSNYSQIMVRPPENTCERWNGSSSKKSGRLRIIEFFRFDFPGSWSPSWLGGRLVSHPSCPKMVMHESMSDWRMILPTGIVHVDRLVWKLLALFKEMIARSDFFWDAVVSTPTATVSFSQAVEPTLNQLFFAQPTISFFHEMLKTIILSLVVGQLRIYPCHNMPLHLLIYRPNVHLLKCMYGRGMSTVYRHISMIDDIISRGHMIWRVFYSCKLYWRLHQRIRSCHMGTTYFRCADLREDR